jgi:hypothetical protein
VGGILKNVEGRHGGIAEAVDEEGFEFAFEEVEGDEGAGEGLEGRGSGAGGFVDVGSGEVEERVDEEGAEIFDDKDGAPGDLEAWDGVIRRELAEWCGVREDGDIPRSLT